jgi:hypothetical protein
MNRENQNRENEHLRQIFEEEHLRQKYQHVDTDERPLESEEEESSEVENGKEETGKEEESSEEREEEVLVAQIKTPDGIFNITSRSISIDVNESLTALFGAYGMTNFNQSEVISKASGLAKHNTLYYRGLNNARKAVKAIEESVKRLKQSMIEYSFGKTLRDETYLKMAAIPNVMDRAKLFKPRTIRYDEIRHRTNSDGVYIPDEEDIYKTARSNNELSFVNFLYF